MHICKNSVSVGLALWIVSLSSINAAPVLSISISQELKEVERLLSEPQIKVDYRNFGPELTDENVVKMHAIVENETWSDKDKKSEMYEAARNPPAGRKSWTGSALEWGKDMAVYSSIAYCSNARSLASWTCAPACLDPRVAGTRHVKTFINDFTQAHAFAAVNVLKRSIIFAFRGTHTVENWINNLDFARRDYPAPVPDYYKSNATKIGIHQGFWNIYQSIREPMREALVELRSKYPDYTIIFTGQSLGGAIATLAVAEYFVTESLPASQTKLITIGQPRVGNSEFTYLLGSFNIDIFRIVEENDIVPHLPPKSFGFIHSIGEKYHMGGNCYMCQDNEDSLCSNSRVPFLSIKAHNFAFGAPFAYKCTDDEAFLASVV